MDYNNFAVVGNPISHSLSPVSFSKYIIEKVGYNYSRILLQDIDQLLSIVNAFNIKGVNVTAPFKKDILKIAGSQAKEVKLLNVANTIIFKEGGSIAYNSDLRGVQRPLQNREIPMTSSFLILGAGGAAKAVILALENIGFGNISLSNRSMDKVFYLKKYHNIKPVSLFEVNAKNYDVIINTIPLKLELFDKLTFNKKAIIFDANYNTKPLKEAAKKAKSEYIDGIEWLIEQGKRSYELMTGIETGEIIISEDDLLKIKRRSKKISLIGPMGSWKSSVGRLLAEKLNFKFYDIDDIVEEKEGRSISDIFKDKGEDYFRKLENQVLKEVLEHENIVLSTGGGIVKRDENIEVLKANSWNILLYASPEECFSRINIDKRPLLQGKDVLKVLTELFKERKDNYFETSDLIINTENKTSTKITEYLYEDYNKTFRN